MIDPPPIRRPRGRIGLYRYKAFRDLLQLVRTLRIVTEPGSGLEHEETPSGTRLWLQDPGPTWIRITARDGVKYAWNALRALDGGGWDDLARPSGTTVTNWAEEANGVMATVPQVARSWTDPYTRKVIFERDLCS